MTPSGDFIHLTQLLLFFLLAIECPCGQFKEEGTMIQCEKCQIWQHLDCVESPPEDPETPYFCCKCSNVKPSLDIKLVPQPEHYPGIVLGLIYR